MKYSSINILFFSIILVFAGCQDDWLEPEPLSFFSPENAFNSPEGIDAALLRARLGLRQDYEGSFWLRINSEYIWTDLANQGNPNSAHPHDAVTQLIPANEPRTFSNHWYWDHAYGIIQVMNLIINKIDQPEYESDEQKNALLGEAYFHRAYWYYRLVHQYGNVPYVGQEINKPKLDFRTFSKETILQKIKEDMEFAVEWLPEQVDGGKVSRAAGNHLLTKIYLSVREFDNAIGAATRIIENENHALMIDRFGSGSFADDPEYNVLWDLYQKENIGSPENKEAILIAPNAFNMQGNSNDNKGNMTIRNWTPLWWRIPGMRYKENNPDPQSAKFGRGIGYVSTSPFFVYDLVDTVSGDLRFSKVNWQNLTDLYYNDPESPKFGERVTFNDYKAMGSDTFRVFPFFINKFVIPQERLGQYEGGFADQYIFRVAETYLLRAEAYFWNGNLEQAADDINVIRSRAEADLVAPSDITIDYIMDERARELYGETPRKTELVRVSYIMANLNLNGYSLDNLHVSNYYIDRINSVNTVYNKGVVYAGQTLRIEPYHIYWPIPQSVIDANTGNVINQNPGYTGFEKNVEPVTQITDED